MESGARRSRHLRVVHIKDQHLLHQRLLERTASSEPGSDCARNHVSPPKRRACRWELMIDIELRRESTSASEREHETSVVVVLVMPRLDHGLMHIEVLQALKQWLHAKPPGTLDADGSRMQANRNDAIDRKIRDGVGK